MSIVNAKPVPTMWLTPDRSALDGLLDAAQSAKSNASSMVDDIDRMVKKTSRPEHRFEQAICQRRLDAISEFERIIASLLEDEADDLLVKVTAEAVVEVIGDFVYSEFQKLKGDGCDLEEGLGYLSHSACNRVSRIGLNLTWSAGVIARARRLFDPIDEEDHTRFKELDSLAEVSNA